jgi:hypothetical protein
MRKTILFALIASLFLSGFAQNRCEFQYGKTENDSLQCFETLSLFKNYYDNNYYIEAYQQWKNIIEKCPCSWNAIFNTQYLQNMFDELIQSTNDDVLKIQYIEDVLFSVGARHEYFPKNYSKGSGLGYKAYFMIRYNENSSENRNLAFNLFVKSIEMEKENTQPLIWDNYFRIAEQIASVTKDTAMLIEAYKKATKYIEMAIINYNIELDNNILSSDNLEKDFVNGYIKQAEYENRKQMLSQDEMRFMQFIGQYKKTLKNIELNYLKLNAG